MSALNHTAERVEFPVGQVQAPANVLANRFLHVMLYITILSSFFVVVEPAPYEYLAAVLGFACVLARVGINRIVLPLLLLLLIRDAGGAIGLLKILDAGWTRLAGDPDPLGANFEYPDSMRFLATSFYLGLTAVMFACLIAQDTTRRIATLGSAYIMSAAIASILGIVGYFKLLPDLALIATDERATGGFKGPNDLGAFLIPALMWLIQGLITDKFRLHNLVATIVIFVGLLLTFSRGAWASTLICVASLIYLLFLTQTDRRSRNRILFFIAGGAIVAVAIFMVLSSSDAISQMFMERTQLQSYDVNADNRSRLLLERDSLREIFNHPLGMGPWGFAHATNWVSHNTYLGVTLNHGWIGGAAYLTLIALTLAIGFRAIWMRSPWQPFVIATYVSFLAMVFEGIWGDTDHWRHFYLLLGLVWGLVAATQKVVWREHAKAFLNGTDLLRPGMRSFRPSLERQS